MLSLYGLFILLLTAEAIHAQGGKNNDDGANQASGSKDVTNLPRRADSLRRTRASWKTKASSSVDPQLGNGSKGPRWLRNLFGSSTSHDPPQPDKIPLPVRVGKAEAESYNQDQDIEQYNAFTEKSWQPHNAGRLDHRSSLSLMKLRFRCTCRDLAMRMSMSQRLLDYITLENEFMLIMDYLDESWVSLASYMKEKIRLDIEDARNIIKEIINAAISLKQHGVFHNDIHSMYQ
ncbi:hypothetical protein BASA62_005683 [Batrachochytrium salamandrivorans]|nr:hypothetical protein BASA62_005683 [Batrachochytrium salamandrivorans]